MKQSALMLAAVMAAAMGQMPDKFGYVQTNVTPAEAGVFLDGKYMGPAMLFADKARAIRVAAGNHRVEFVDPFHNTLVSDLQVADGQHYAIGKQMKPNGKEPGRKFSVIVTEGFGEAAVYLDGEYWGHAGRMLRVKPGKFMMKITGMDGTILREIKVELRNAETLVVTKEGAPVVRRGQ